MAVTTSTRDRLRTLAERQKALVDRLYTGLNRDDGLAVAGREEVGEMLEQRRVETLLVTAGLHDPAAVAAALEQDADVVVLPDLPDLADGIGALLRF